MLKLHITFQSVNVLVVNLAYFSWYFMFLIQWLLLLISTSVRMCAKIYTEISDVIFFGPINYKNWWRYDLIFFSGPCLFVCFFFFPFLLTCRPYLGLVEVGERTYINGPPNPPLNLPAHLCSITYRTMYCKTRKMEKLLIRSRRTFMVGWFQLRGWKSKNNYGNYPKGDSITEQNVAGWWTIDLS